MLLYFVFVFSLFLGRTTSTCNATSTFILFCVCCVVQWPPSSRLSARPTGVNLGLVSVLFRLCCRWRSSWLAILPGAGQVPWRQRGLWRFLWCWIPFIHRTRSKTWSLTPSPRFLSSCCCFSFVFHSFKIVYINLLLFSCRNVSEHVDGGAQRAIGLQCGRWQARRSWLFPIQRRWQFSVDARIGLVSWQWTRWQRRNECPSKRAYGRWDLTRLASPSTYAGSVAVEEAACLASRRSSSSSKATQTRH